MKLKYISLLLLAVLGSYSSQCQIKYIPPADHSFSVGVGGGVTKLYGDFYGKPEEPAGWVDINYNLTTYLSLGLQGQVGNLTTGGLNVGDKPVGFYTMNAYEAGSADFRLSLGVFLMHAPVNTFTILLSGIYGGAGVGIIESNIKTETRGGVDQTALLVGGLKDIKKSSWTPNVPIDAGININMPTIFGYSGLAINLDYQYNITQSDYVDGYDPKKPANKHNDTYTYISGGLRFYFGHLK